MSLLVLAGASGCGAAVAPRAGAELSRPAGPTTAAEGAAANAGTAAAPALGRAAAHGSSAHHPATDAASALALALPVLFQGTPDLVVRNTHALSYAATTAGEAAKAVGVRWTGPASAPAWLVVGTAVVGPACKCDPPKPETVWAIVRRGGAAVTSGATAQARGLRHLTGWVRVPDRLTASLSASS